MTSTTPSVDSAPELISSSAKRFPNSIALSDGKQTLNYGELDRHSDRFAGYLNQLGVSPGDAVVVCMERSFDWIVAALGIMKAGAAYVPLDPAWPDSRVQFAVTDSGAAVFVGSKTRLNGLETKVRDVVPARDAAAIAASRNAISSSVDPKSLAYIVYTSGSTGVPKGVEITHANLGNLVQWHNNAFAISQKDRTSHLAGLGFDAAVWEIWPTLCAGATLCLAGSDVRLTGESIQRWMVEERVTVGFVPTVYAAPMMAMKWPAATALRYLLTGGDTLHRTVQEPLPFKVVNNYGPAECTVVATSGVLDMNAEGLPPIGRAIAGARVYVLDEDRKPVRDGIVGEIYVGGDGVGRGYRNLPEATERAFVPDPFTAIPGARMYRTGDQALRRPDGALEFRGRLDRQIKIRGQRVELDEIGNILARHPGVDFAAAIARTSPDGTMHLVAYFLPRDKSTPPGERELAAHAEKTLPAYMVPSMFVQLDSLPVSPNGKIDLSQLPEQSIKKPKEPEAPAPASNIERKLHGIVEDLLGGRSIAGDDNLFLSGGHSLFGMQLITRVRSAFGVDLSLHRLFESPTVHGLAAWIQSQREDGDTSRIAAAPQSVEHRSCCEAAPQAATNSCANTSTPGTVSSANGSQRDETLSGVRNSSLAMEATEEKLKANIEHTTGVLPLHANGTRIPIFWVHQLAINLAREMGEDQPFFIVTLTASDLTSLGRRPALKQIAACLLRKILAERPDGPFILGSLCVGSVLVYEIAQQMKAAGHDLRLLILLDAPTQPYLRSATSVSSKLLHAGSAIQRMKRIGLSSTVANFRKRLIKSIPFSLRLKLLKPDWNTAHEMVENAAFVYYPEPYEGEVLLLLSANAPSHLDFLPGWRAVVRGKLNVNYVDGHHRDFITQQNVNAIAEIVAENLPAAAEVASTRAINTKLSNRTSDARGFRDVTTSIREPEMQSAFRTITGRDRSPGK